METFRKIIAGFFFISIASMIILFIMKHWIESLVAFAIAGLCFGVLVQTSKIGDDEPWHKWWF